MAEIKFSSKAHRDFFVEMMGKCRKNDTYHRAFFYIMGIAPETRANINRMFDFKNDWIIPEGMHVQRHHFPEQHPPLWWGYLWNPVFHERVYL